MLTIVLPLYRRPQYAEQVLQALFAEPLDFGHTVTRDCVEVIISIDGGGIVPRLEYETYGTHVQVIIHQGQHFGLNRHIAWLLRMSNKLSKANYTLLFEEDTVPCNAWRQLIQTAIEHDYNAMSLHPDLHTIENMSTNPMVYASYEKTKRTSSWGLLLRNSLVPNLLSIISHDTRTWDYSLNRALDGINRESCYCAAIPHTRHIGISGSDFTPETHPTEILNKAYENAQKIHEKVCATNQH